MNLPDPDRTRAFLFGTAFYQNDDLLDIPAVMNNLLDLGQVLSAAEYPVVKPENCVIMPQPQMPEVGIRLESLAQEATDTLLVYYAGHGIPTSTGDLHLAIADTNPRYVHFTALDFRLVRRAMLTSTARNKILILDCCFSGRAIEAMGDPAALVAGETEIFGGYTLTSTGKNLTSVAPAGECHTAFTGALIACIRGGPPAGREFLTLQDIYTILLRGQSAKGFPRPQQSGSGSILRLALAGKRRYEAVAGDERRIRSEKYQVAMSVLARRKSLMEQKIDALRNFEREFRTRLKKYFESQILAAERGEPVDLENDISRRLRTYFFSMRTSLRDELNPSLAGEAPVPDIDIRGNGALVVDFSHLRNRVLDLEKFALEYHGKLDAGITLLLDNEEICGPNSFGRAAMGENHAHDTLALLRNRVAELDGQSHGPFLLRS